jgi:mono/diheme cytochrome c family protein
MTHMPIGLVVGAFFLGWSALVFKRPGLMPSAYHVLVIAFLFWFPTVVFGYLDWQRYYAGAMLHPIVMKLMLAGLLFVLMSAGLILGARKNTNPRVMALIYTLSFATVAVLGYYGGQLVYTGATPAGPTAYQAGERLFDANCSGCHAHGGNSISPNLPLKGAPQLADAAQFIAFLRTPRTPGGQPGVMPAFPAAKMSDQDARALYDYIEKIIATPDRGQPPTRQ